jgi:muramoyltetrapeptide carboxypeptidase
MIWPRPLKKGDTVAMLAPSGPCNPTRLNPAVKALEDFEIHCLVMDSCYRQRDYLAGSDAERVSDLHHAFANPSVKGIFAARGGYGAQRLLPLLDYGLVRRHPKCFVGYSDVTALHSVFNGICGFVTFHAPMPLTDLCREPDGFSLHSLKYSLFGEPVLPYPLLNPRNNPLVCLFPGQAKGRLTGGNLSLLAASLGTAYEIDTFETILFIEEINEEPYKIDRMFLQLKLAGKFRDCSGIILGRFSPVTLPGMEMAVNELLIPEGKPVLGNFCCGHGLPSHTLPLGAEVFMDASGKKVILT